MGDGGGIIFGIYIYDSRRNEIDTSLLPIVANSSSCPTLPGAISVTDTLTCPGYPRCSAVQCSKYKQYISVTSICSCTSATGWYKDSGQRKGVFLQHPFHTC